MRTSLEFMKPAERRVWPQTMEPDTTTKSSSSVVKEKGRTFAHFVNTAGHPFNNCIEKDSAICVTVATAGARICKCSPKSYGNFSSGSRPSWTRAHVSACSVFQTKGNLPADAKRVRGYLRSRKSKTGHEIRKPSIHMQMWQLPDDIH